MQEAGSPKLPEEAPEKGGGAGGAERVGLGAEVGARCGVLGSTAKNDGGKV